MEEMLTHKVFNWRGLSQVYHENMFIKLFRLPYNSFSVSLQGNMVARPVKRKKKSKELF